jgi:hypothetical protein
MARRVSTSSSSNRERTRIDRIQRFRGRAGLLDLARKPGRLTQAMQIDLGQVGLDLCAAVPLWLAASRRKTGAICERVRIGLTRNVDRKPLLRARQSVREWSKEVTPVVRRSLSNAQHEQIEKLAYRLWEGTAFGITRRPLVPR